MCCVYFFFYISCFLAVYAQLREFFSIHSDVYRISLFQYRNIEKKKKKKKKNNRHSCLHTGDSCFVYTLCMINNGSKRLAFSVFSPFCDKNICCRTLSFGSGGEIQNRFFLMGDGHLRLSIGRINYFRSTGRPDIS